jgi:predicted methyltransferase
MTDQKKALFVVFKPEKLPTSEELRAQFTTSYPIFANMDEVEYKCWWISQEKGTWGALYVFRSSKELESYISSERWLKLIPEKYGCTPTSEVMDVGLILSKATILNPEESWL